MKLCPNTRFVTEPITGDILLDPQGNPVESLPRDPECGCEATDCIEPALTGFTSEGIDPAMPVVDEFVTDPGGMTLTDPQGLGVISLPRKHGAGCTTTPCLDNPFGNYSTECIDTGFLPDKFLVCACLGEFYSVVYRAFGFGPWTWTVSGLPTDINYVIDPSCGEIFIHGTFEATGRFFATVTVTDGSGNVTTAKLQFNIMGIVTTTIPTPSLNVPYNVQLQAAGGSGHYAWKLTSGSLAQGLTLSIDGLISGTPTAAQPDQVTFEVIDLECESVDPTFYPPSVTLTGTETITKRVWKGFNEFVASSPPNRYKTLTWSGQVHAFGTPGLYHHGQDITLGYCGASTINDDGSPGINRNMTGYSSCQADRMGNCTNTNPGVPLVLSGCLSGPVVAGTLYSEVFGVTPGTNWDSPGAGLVARDGVWGLPNEAGYNNIVSATHAEKNGSFLQQAGHVLTTINRTVILSDLYTDADANATAVTTTTPGLVAFNSERANNGYVDLKATLAYTLAFDNLMFGQNYIATVTWVTSGGVATVHSYPFTAGGSMHTITDNVTLPPNGEFLVVMLPTIQSA